MKESGLLIFVVVVVVAEYRDKFTEILGIVSR